MYKGELIFMKRSVKIVFSLLLCVTLFSMMSFTAFASATKTEIEAIDDIVYFDDGSYCITTIEPITNTSLLSGADGTLSTTSSITATKSTTYYSALNVALWKFNLTGTFTYNGTTSTCTSASCSVNIYNSSWYIDSKAASKSGNKATGSVVMKRSALGLTIVRTANLTMTCDKNGNIS